MQKRLYVCMLTGMRDVRDECLCTRIHKDDAFAYAQFDASTKIERRTCF